MFWFKRKKLVLDAFTTCPAAYEFSPVTAMKDNFPDWWKKLPTTVFQNNSVGLAYPGSTIKRCDGILALFAQGFCVPMWTDMIIETQSDGSYKYQMVLSSNDPVSEHGHVQMGPEFDDLIHMKIHNIWNFSEKTGVEFHFTSAWWNNIKLLPNLFIPPAIINFKYQPGAELNIFLPKINQRLELQAGQPMIHLTPLTEHDMDIRCHLIDRAEMDRRFEFHAPTRFQNVYKRKKADMQAKEKKCPFGFGRK